MTCYLTDGIDPDEIARGLEEGVWIAAKLYPAGATTNSASGVTDVRNVYPTLERMQRIGMVLCVHGEVTDPDVDVFDREAVFIDRVLSSARARFPGASRSSSSTSRLQRRCSSWKAPGEGSARRSLRSI